MEREREMIVYLYTVIIITGISVITIIIIIMSSSSSSIVAAVVFVITIMARSLAPAAPRSVGIAC